MAHYPALLKAAAFNAGVILDYLDDGACPRMPDIRRVCAANGYADDISIDTALSQLLSDGLIVNTPDGYLKAYTTR